MKVSDYGTQLREKQRVKRMYGLQEKQFRLQFFKAARQQGITGTNLLVLLERRLDNIVYRLGFVSSRQQARQLVTHKHFMVNGKNVNIPSYLVKIGDQVTLKEKSRTMPLVSDAIETVARRGIPQWLELDRDNFTGNVMAFPVREDLTMPIEEQLIVELYSK